VCPACVKPKATLLDEQGMMPLGASSRNHVLPFKSASKTVVLDIYWQRVHLTPRVQFAQVFQPWLAYQSRCQYRYGLIEFFQLRAGDKSNDDLD
jgi:hypothetical protein